MEETAYFLNLVVKSDKPVVLVGLDAAGDRDQRRRARQPLQRGRRRGRARGRAGRGVLVVLNDEIHAARNVTKTNTTNVETFESPNRGPQGLVHTAQIAWFEPHGQASTRRESEFAVELPTELPRVDIIYAHANMSPT